MNGVVAVCALALLAAGVSRALAAESAPKDLRLFYQENCVSCHGADGSARGARGKSLKGQDFTDARWLKRTTDAEMVEVILNGEFFGLAMPAFKKQLSREEAQRLVSDIIRKATQGKAIGPEPKGTDLKQP